MSTEAELQRVLDRADELNMESAELVASAELYAAEAKLHARKAVAFALLAVLAAVGAAVLMVYT